ncbi:MAG: histidine kinase, partial [Bacteroidota bacterium]
MDSANVEFLQLTLIGVVVMLFLALTIVILYVAYQRRGLTQQRIINELQKQQQRQLLTATIAAQENERQRIAADLHDDVGLLLTTSQLFLRQISVQPEAAEHRQTALDLIDDSLVRIRAISRGLGTSNLTQFGLESALNDLIVVLSQGSQGPQISIISDLAGRLDAEQE